MKEQVASSVPLSLCSSSLSASSKTSFLATIQIFHPCERASLSEREVTADSNVIAFSDAPVLSCVVDVVVVVVDKSRFHLTSRSLSRNSSLGEDQIGRIKNWKMTKITRSEHLHSSCGRIEILFNLTP